MNQEHTLRLIEILREQKHTDYEAPSGFNMEHWKHSCGTPSCIGGFCAFILKSDDDYVKCTSDYLKISYQTARALCIPKLTSEQNTQLNEITPAQTIIALEKLLAADGKLWGNEIWDHLE